MFDERETASFFIAVQSDMQSTRGNFEIQWQEVAERIWPDRATFVRTQQEGRKNTEKVFDETATLALPRFASAVESLITPRTSRWHGLANRHFLDDMEVKSYFEAFTDALFDMRYSPHSNFASQMFEVYMSVGAFGTGALLVEDVPGYGIRYKSMHLAELYMLENKVGNIDLVHRKFKLTAKQAYEQFGEELSDGIKSSKDRNPSTRFEFLHCVHPNTIKNEPPFKSCYIELAAQKIVAQGFYHSFPYLIGRYITTPNETYGRGPAMMVLNEIKTVQEMAKTILKAGQLSVQPPLLLPEDGVLNAFNFAPGALNYGGVDERGQQMVHPLVTGANLEMAMNMITEKRKIINEAFLISLFQILVDKPYMTASEALLRAQEKGQLLAPTMGRLQSELVGPLIEREVDIMSRSPTLSKRWAVPAMPMQLKMVRGDYAIEYVSPLNKMQKGDEVVGIMKTLEMITPIAQIDQSILKTINARRLLPIIAEANGAPTTMFYTPQEMEAIDQQAVTQQQATALMQAAPILGKTAKDMTQAAATAQNVPALAGLNMMPGVQ